jgi:hypothetical protein
MDDQNRALSLFARAETLEPQNPRWPDQQAEILALGYYSGIDDEVLATSYTKLARAAELAGEDERVEYEGRLAVAAFHSGEFDRARQHANRALQMIAKSPPTMWTGNVHYEAHTTLGRLALQSGDVRTAKKHLIEAAKTTGSPSLDTFGPDMTLARELLDAGERDAVIQYLELVERFWDGKGPLLKEWRQQIRLGERPYLDD